MPAAQALREFEEFSKRYPDDKRIPEVQNWISILRTVTNLSRSIEEFRKLDVLARGEEKEELE